jgi:HlyD family secretion protein
MKKTGIITGIVVVFTMAALILFNKITSKKEMEDQFAVAMKGDFEIAISAAGELVAENSVDIKAPEIARGRDVRAQDLKITDMIPEGTEVEEGDFIATLDRTQYDNTLQDETERLKTFQINLETKMLDTAVTLTGLRDNIKNQRHTVEEAEITLRNSKYEPPTTIRQAEINLDKQKRILEQSMRSYQLRKAQVSRDIRNQRMWISRFERRVNDLQEILSLFTIKAPAPGMVVYKKDRRGNKIKAGSTINAFDRVIATLPDLSSMLSKIYVSEIEISKVKPGQDVTIKVDAFPDKTYVGKVFTVANIGEKLPNTDSKVFEVMVRLDGSDPTLRPTMTTGNRVIVKTISNVVYIPTEAVVTGSDGIPFVYTRNKIKKIVIPGDSNEKYIVIQQGLKSGEKVYLSIPENSDKFKVEGQELLDILNGGLKEKLSNESAVSW